MANFVYLFFLIILFLARLYMAHFDCLQHLEIFSEIRVMPMKLQIAVFRGITQISENISSC